MTASISTENENETKNENKDENQQEEPENKVTALLPITEEIFGQIKTVLEQRRHVPAAVYRLQFNKYFTFNQAREQIDYLYRLGITDLYASPYFRARQDSMHGYDVADHNHLNPAIGTEEEYNQMVEELHRKNMSQLLDIVPNHMGIGETTNTWWMDVLENGPASIYAPFFDIDWHPIKDELENKVLLPVLGEMYGRVLENQELQLKFYPERGAFELNYYDHIFPVNPRSYKIILEHCQTKILENLGEETEAALEYQSILTAIRNLPRLEDTEQQSRIESNREKEIIKRRLAALSESEPRFLESVESCVTIFNGTKGEPRSFDALAELLENQAYRLSYWRVAAEEINYRRFFDVNDLAAVRVDQLFVFRETHRTILKLVREGKVNGLRIDHIDGLRNPYKYLNDLQCAYFLEFCRAEMDSRELKGEEREIVEALLRERYEQECAASPQGELARALYVVIEKILGRGEPLPGEWQTFGTTGYDFTNQVNELFVDGANQKAFDQLYAAFTGNKIKFADLIYQTKRQIMLSSLASEVNVLTNLLNKISERDRYYRDLTLYSLRGAIREVIACFPVYRTYVTRQQEQPSKQDQANIEAAVKQAKKRNPAQDTTAFDFLRDVLLLKYPEYLGEEDRTARYNFVMKFQQCTGPVIAKGLEDTAFYIYNRLTSLNEVGGEPDQFGATISGFHRQQIERQRNWPNALLTTSTHDTKRSEDVRARINVLSEIPKEWKAALGRWARMNRRKKINVDGQPAPSRNEEYFLYQTLLGIWPFNHNPLANPEIHQDLINRVQAYMEKAMKEAKVNTSWVNQNAPYEEAVRNFVAAILDPKESEKFLADLGTFQKRIAHYGAFNAVSQTLIKLTSPGVPDIYQGNDTWDFSLVDPDNRRPIDYSLRSRMLDEVSQMRSPAEMANLIEHKEDGRIKLFVTARALSYRRDNCTLYESGSYTPADVQGTHAENILAFARALNGKTAITIAPRFFTRLTGKTDENASVTGKLWAGSWLVLPNATVGDKYHNQFTGEELEVKEYLGKPALPMEEILAAFPVALLEK